MTQIIIISAALSFFTFPSHCQDCKEQRSDQIQSLCPGNGTHIGARSCSPAVAPILRVSIAIVSPLPVFQPAQGRSQRSSISFGLDIFPNIEALNHNQKSSHG
jgi:hypothetical protein